MGQLLACRSVRFYLRVFLTLSRIRGFFLALRVEINSHLLLWYRSLLCGSFVLRADLFRVVLSLSRTCVTSAQFVNI